MIPGSLRQPVPVLLGVLRETMCRGGTGGLLNQLLNGKPQPSLPDFAVASGSAVNKERSAASNFGLQFPQTQAGHGTSRERIARDVFRGNREVNPTLQCRVRRSEMPSPVRQAVPRLP